MCTRCESNAHAPSRRLLLQAAGVALAAIVTPAVASAQSAPPKPENVLSPDQAFDRLMEGNQRYVQGFARRHDFLNEREALTTGQNPYAGILSCADSRIAPIPAAAICSFAVSPAISSMTMGSRASNMPFRSSERRY
jgi:carbonic anhydrase